MIFSNKRKKIKLPYLVCHEPENAQPIQENNSIQISDRDNYILNLSKHDRTEYDVNRNLIILNAHFIEKEMAVNNVDTASMKFLEPISKALLVLLRENYVSDKFAILLATKLLLTYDSADTLNVQSKIPDEYKKECLFIEVGRKHISEPISDERFKTFLKERHSYRRYKDELIDEAIIKSVIDVASNCPSACNRQPYKVTYSTTKEGNDLIRKIVPDKFVGKNIPNFFIVTIDRAMFNPGEELQELVNGGIFLENLLLSLHAHGLGATAFQTSIFVSENRENLKPYGLADSEIVVATIGFGIPEDKTTIVAAQKRRPEDISRRI